MHLKRTQPFCTLLLMVTFTLSSHFLHAQYTNSDYIRSQRSPNGGGAYIQDIAESGNSYSRAVFSHNAYWDFSSNVWRVGQTGANDAQAIVIPNNDGFKFVIHSSTGNTTRSFSNSSFLNGTKMTIRNNGKVGIGLTNPRTLLEVTGDISMARSYKLRFLEAAGGAERAFIGSTNGQNGDYNGLVFGTGSGNERMRIKSDGNVGIGTTDPGNYKLAVNGTIRAKEIKVETGWADFVFEEDYLLRSLNEVEQYINAHKHLPDIPSAAEVAENGVPLGEISSKLLQKIEELTLYMIALEKENKKLQEEMKVLKAIVSNN